MSANAIAIPAALEMRARSIWYLGNKVNIQLDACDTNGQFAVIEAVTKPGSEPPMHIHSREDETFVVLEGKVEVIVDGVETVLGPGELKFAPRGVPHTFRILTPTARTLGFITPAGFEDFFRTLGSLNDPTLIPTREQIAAAAAEFGVRLA